MTAPYSTRDDLRTEMELWREAGSASTEDDHYYGAWYGGSKSAGGHPGKPGAGKGGAAGKRDPALAKRFGKYGGNVPEPTQATIDAEMAKIAHKKDHEVGVGVDEKGNVVARANGGDHYVDFDDAQMARMENGHLVHNHPSGYPLSEQDVRLAMRDNLAGIHAIGVSPHADGKRYRYSLTRPEKGWPTVKGRVEYAFADAHAVGRHAAQQFYVAEMKRLGFGPDRLIAANQGLLAEWSRANEQVTRQAMHIEWTRFAEAAGVHYERVEWHD